MEADGVVYTAGDLTVGMCRRTGVQPVCRGRDCARRSALVDRLGRRGGAGKGEGQVGVARVTGGLAGGDNPPVSAGWPPELTGVLSVSLCGWQGPECKKKMFSRFYSFPENVSISSFLLNS